MMGNILLIKFDMARVKDPLNRHHLDFVEDTLKTAKIMFRVGNVDRAFRAVELAIDRADLLLKSSEDFDKVELVQNVSQQVRELLPRFDAHDRKQILRDLATIEKPEAAQQQHLALNL